MIAFTYADNSEAVSKSLAAFQEALADEGPALRRIADDFREMLAQQFASEGGAEGTPWAPRKSVGAVHEPPSRSNSSRGAIRELPLLIRTGALRDSLMAAGARGHVEEVDRTSLSLGSRLPYAIFHQTGTRWMPARPVIVVTQARSAKWTEMVRGALEEKTLLLGAKELGT